MSGVYSLLVPHTSCLGHKDDVHLGGPVHGRDVNGPIAAQLSIKNQTVQSIQATKRMGTHHQVPPLRQGQTHFYGKHFAPQFRWPWKSSKES